MSQVTAQETIFQNLGHLISLPSTFYAIAGKVQRIAELHEVIDELEADVKALKSTPSTASARHKTNTTTAAKSSTVEMQVEHDAAPPIEPSCISFEGVDIVSPAGECFAADVSFSVTQGAGMMVTGRSAAGKTSLVRVLSGPCIATTTIHSAKFGRYVGMVYECENGNDACANGVSIRFRAHRTLADAKWQRCSAYEWPSWPASPT